MQLEGPQSNGNCDTPGRRSKRDPNVPEPTPRPRTAPHAGPTRLTPWKMPRAQDESDEPRVPCPASSVKTQRKGPEVNSLQPVRRDKPTAAHAGAKCTPAPRRRTAQRLGHRFLSIPRIPGYESEYCNSERPLRLRETRHPLARNETKKETIRPK